VEYDPVESVFVEIILFHVVPPSELELIATGVSAEMPGEGCDGIIWPDRVTDPPRVMDEADPEMEIVVVDLKRAVNV
jgi:hypothetical protein